MALACHHPGALFLDPLHSEKEVPTPGTLQSAMLCGQMGPFWQAGLGFCRQGQFWAVASQEACPSAHLIALTHLLSCNKAGWLTQPPAKPYGHGRGLCKSVVSTLGIIDIPPSWRIMVGQEERSHSPSLKGIVFWFLLLAVGHAVTGPLLHRSLHVDACGL